MASLPPPVPNVNNQRDIPPSSAENSVVIDFSTPKARKNYKYDLPEPANYKNLSDKEKFEFCKKRVKALKEFRVLFTFIHFL